MADRLEFTAKLAGILENGKEQDYRMSFSEVEEYFKEDDLNEEQLALVCEYLMSQKVIVSGFVPRKGEIKEVADGDVSGNQEGINEAANKGPLKGRDALSNAEKEFAKEYLRDIESMRPKTEEEMLLKKLMPQVVEIAMDLKRPEIPLGDLVQEGSMALLLGVQKLREPAEIIWEDEEEESEEFISSEEYSRDATLEEDDLEGEALERKLLEEVRSTILTMIEEQTETKARDKKMVSKVSDLDEIIQKMKDDFGRKVSVEEVAEQSGLSPDEIANILKLAGEDAPEEDEDINDLFHVVENGEMPKE